MSEENVELVRRWANGLAGGELSLELCDPELRLENIAQFPITGPYHGHEGLRRWWQDVAEAFDEIRYEVDELIDVDDERVLSVQRVVGRFRNTGIPVDTPWASLFWVRDGKITRAVGYASRHRALKAAGLREPMSEEKAERIREATDAVNRGDFDAWVACLSPDVVWESPSVPGFKEVYRGRGEAREWIVEVLELWKGVHTEIEQITELSKDRLLVAFVRTARGRASDLPVEMHDWSVLWFADGLITRRQGFRTREEAREAAGLREWAMWEKNVEIVRRGYWAWNRGDLDWQLDHITPDFEFRTAQLFPDTEAVYRGRGGFRQFWNTLREPWETFHIEVERIETIGDDRVLTLFRFHGRGRDGVEVEAEYANLFTLEGGMVSRLAGFADWQQALEAAGLRD
jgi:ketosteroid isomerase-like protein